MSGLRFLTGTVRRWFDSQAEYPLSHSSNRVDWLRCLPFMALHAGCLAVFWVGWSSVAVIVALLLYLVRMFAITGFYHRYFSHRTFQTSRVVQFLFGLAGTSAVQRGPLWWAAHHREHHIHADKEEDPHSPQQDGLLWSHMGWFMTPENFSTRPDLIPDLANYRELRWLDRFDVVGPLLLAASLLTLGYLLQTFAPWLETSPVQLLVWGFFISTVVLFHATSAINSLAHRVGRRRYETRDQSRNSLLLALLTLGEGWHNNHHHYPASTRQGFFWWEVDLTYYGLWLLSKLGIIWNLRDVPAHVREAKKL